MFIIPENKIMDSGIESEFLIPYVKGPAELESLEFTDIYNYRLFVCSLPLYELKRNFIGAYNWIKKFEKATNRNAMKTIQEACSGNKPYWYSLRPKQANIVTSINPYERCFFSYSEAPFTIDQRLVAINVCEDYSVELIAALLNSIVTFLSIEMRGTSRNLGALDLNANYFKKLRILNPSSLTKQQKTEIIKAFEPLKHRSIRTIFEEVKLGDRINLDKTILRCYGIDPSILENLYQTLVSAVNDRVTMKEK
jgi:hypothetical protein